MRESRGGFSAVRHAFTAIEVLAATTIASLLMVSVLGVLAGIAKKERLIDQVNPNLDWQAEIALRLRTDLEAAETIDYSNGKLTIEAHTDDCASAPRWLPSQLTYVVAETGRELTLIRISRSKVTPGNTYSSEIVCFGVDNFTLTPEFAPGEASKEFHASSAKDIPRKLRLVLSNQARIVLEQVINLR